MKQFLVYTTDGDTTAPDGSEVENCQVLAFVDAEDAEDAQCIFCMQEAWAVAKGYRELIVEEVVGERREFHL